VFAGMRKQRLLPLFGLLLAACASEAGSRSSGVPTEGPGPGATPPVGDSKPAGGDGTAPGGGGKLPPSGLLTAGAWDDNLNFDFFLKYQTTRMTPAEPGLPQVVVADRLAVLVQDSAAKLVPDATVTVSSNEHEIGRVRTGADGRALIFPAWLGAAPNATLTITARSGEGQGTTVVHAGDATATVSVTTLKPAMQGLDVAIVIDTTGSMGDEIRYLQAETLAISSALRAAYPELSQRWAVIPYRDYHDAYVTSPVDFTDDLQAYQTSLKGLTAEGGDDFPEAPERALADLNQLHWRSGPIARVAFWIADAPHHAEHTKDMVAAMKDAATNGIHVYPIAASSADTLTEFTMRLTALVTGGRYLFLTNDSHIGNLHEEPAIPCYFVTSLQKAMLRMLSMEVTGTRLDPAPTDIIRTGGDPRDGRCTLNDGRVVDLL
jgi:Mg-chelatase subunit ChlD